MSRTSRRDFIRRALAAGTAVALTGGRAAAAASPAPSAPKPPPSERLRLGVIGPDGRGAANRDACGATEEIVALCDIDSKRLASAQSKYPDAKTFRDFRELLEMDDLDAVVISTPDHMHAIPAVRAMNRGLDVYCEKPLAHSVWEVRQMREAAQRNGRVTQMGTQIHAGDNYRRVVEIVRSGVLGPIRRVHVWKGGGANLRGGGPAKRVSEATPPAHVDYDLWLGPAPSRPFHDSHFHFNWRYWWDFGGGVLADFGCHFMDLPHWALDLRAPLTVEAEGEKTSAGDNEVPDNMRVEYHYPARGSLPPVHLTWYHGDWQPEGAEAYRMGNAVLFEGEAGRLIADYGTHKIFLDDDAKVAAADVERIPNSIGHHAEWIRAVKTRGETTCNFDYSGALAETVLLGNVAYRVGEKLRWNDEKLEADVPEAAKFVRREYRDGWSFAAS